MTTKETAVSRFLEVLAESIDLSELIEFAEAKSGKTETPAKPRPKPAQIVVRLNDADEKAQYGTDLTVYKLKGDFEQPMFGLRTSQINDLVEQLQVAQLELS